MHTSNSIDPRTKMKYLKLKDDGIQLVNFGEAFARNSKAVTLRFLTNAMIVAEGCLEPTEATVYAFQNDGFIPGEHLVDAYRYFEYEPIMPYSKCGEWYYPDSHNLIKLIEEIGG